MGPTNSSRAIATRMIRAAVASASRRTLAEADLAVLEVGGPGGVKQFNQGGGQAQGDQGGGGGGGDKKCQKHPEKPECQGRN